MMPAAEQFYTDLPFYKMALSQMIGNENLFQEIPESWQVIITDIQGSTPAVFDGRHQDVNLIATGSIVVVLNIAFSMNIVVPFFFGGDGATFIVPNAVANKAMEALAVYRKNTLANFDMDLRTGIVAVAEIYKADFKINIAKLQRSKSFSIPIVLGNGLAYAETVIKGDDYLIADKVRTETNLDLSGMQCRWDKIVPPDHKEEIVALLVIATDPLQQPSTFQKILEQIDLLYGMHEKRQPISLSKLKLKSTFGKLATEMRVRIGKIRLLELIRNWIITMYGYIYFRTLKGKEYLKSLVEMSDTLVIDGKINTVICGTTAQRKKLEKVLNQMEASGKIFYGLHTSGASIMSCYVRDNDEGHIHFVDGSEGGYTKAAKMLKEKLFLK